MHFDDTGPKLLCKRTSSDSDADHGIRSYCIEISWTGSNLTRVEIAEREGGPPSARPRPSPGLADWTYSETRQ
jgi:hypothetical protein